MAASGYPRLDRQDVPEGCVRLEGEGCHPLHHLRPRGGLVLREPQGEEKAPDPGQGDEGLTFGEEIGDVEVVEDLAEEGGVAGRASQEHRHVGEGHALSGETKYLPRHLPDLAGLARRADDLHRPVPGRRPTDGPEQVSLDSRQVSRALLSPIHRGLFTAEVEEELPQGLGEGVGGRGAIGQEKGQGKLAGSGPQELPLPAVHIVKPVDHELPGAEKPLEVVGPAAGRGQDLRGAGVLCDGVVIPLEEVGEIGGLILPVERGEGTPYLLRGAQAGVAQGPEGAGQGPVKAGDVPDGGEVPALVPYRRRSGPILGQAR